MGNRESFLSKTILFMLTFALVTSMTTASFANEIEGNNIKSQDSSYEDITVGQEDRIEEKEEEGQELDKEEQELYKKEDEKIEEIDSKDIKQDGENNKTRYNKNIPENRIPYIFGTGGAEFHPDQAISRQEAYISFLRTAEILETGKNPLQYPINMVLEELEKRDIYLAGNRKTDLKGKITRAEIADMVDQYLKLEGSSDKTSIQKVKDYSLMSGDKNGNFNGDKNLTRAEMVTVLNRIQNRKVDKASANNLPQVYKDTPKSHWAYAEILEATIAHVVDVTTSEQKWTSHTFTDNDNKKIKATDKYNTLIKPLTDHGIKNPNTKQIQAIEKMNQYIANNDKVKQDFNNGRNLIFAFEGAGDFSDKWTKTAFHNHGRYGAMFIAIKNKKIVYITTNASTLPDNPNKNIKINGVWKKVRTLDSQRENISSFISGNHKTYPGLTPYNLVARVENKSQKVKSLQGIANDGFKFNIHAGRSDEGSMSDGCLTIKDKDYLEFAKAVGYMPEWIEASKNNFSDIYKIGKGKFVPNVTVTLVLDRTLMDENLKNKFWK